MNHVRFYEEFEHKRKRISAGNVVAVIPENRCPDGAMEAVGAVLYCEDSPVASTSVSREYLRTKCRRIPEAKARQIHPHLFEYLDASEAQ